METGGLSQYKSALASYFEIYPGPEVDVQILLSRCPQFGTLLIQNPTMCLPVLEEALGESSAQLQLINVPPCLKKRVSALRSKEDVGLMGIEGTVVRIGITRMLEKVRQFECAKCNTTWEVQSKPEEQHRMVIPRACISRGACKSTNIKEIKGGKKCVDYQMIKLQEQVSKLGVGSIPRSIMVILEGSLVDNVKAGDDVVVVGTLIKCWKPCIKDVRCDLETIIQASSIRLKNINGTVRALVTDDLKREFEQFWQQHKDAPLEGRNIILSSICPQVYGLFIVKLAVALTVIGGCSYVDETGMKTRGKSQFLRFTAELSPRSVLTTGIGTTSAGLTCTAVKDGGEWMLEAGALVLADRGVCCIDEFSSITSNDRASIHEAMEQQTLSVAKAVNTAIASPLLSRFDIILVLLDTVEKEWDHRVSTFILDQAATKELVDAAVDSDRRSDKGVWSVAKLQAYFCYVKETFQPRLSRTAMTILQRYYQMQRSSDMRNAARTTIRLLESLTRISQAHAKLMCRTEVNVQDAVVAIYITETSKSADSMLGYESVLHKNFAVDPMTEYYQHEEVILSQLSLSEFASKPSNYSTSNENSPDPRRPRHTEIRTTTSLTQGNNRWSQAIEAHRSQVRKPSYLVDASHQTVTDRAFDSSQSSFTSKWKKIKRNEDDSIF
ncbi:hypothetical protein Ae201684P_017002 [Aphanomyces euteiches]|nr:hypothetical protein Ae201684P_017002 [Aphanomyces euteiches]